MLGALVVLTVALLVKAKGSALLLAATIPLWNFTSPSALSDFEREIPAALLKVRFLTSKVAVPPTVWLLLPPKVSVPL